MTHEYPPNRTLDSVSISRVSALRDYGLTQRQREFLVTVMVHSGCFLERQYCEFTGTVRGQNSREFMTRLIARGFVRPIESGAIRRGRLYHVHHKPLYEAIGQADNRNRRLCTIGRMVERVMIRVLLTKIIIPEDDAMLRVEGNLGEMLAIAASGRIRSTLSAVANSGCGGSQPTLSAALATCGIRRIAKRQSAFRPSPFFFANPPASITSSIERLGRCWLRRLGFGSRQGHFQGQFVPRLIAPEPSGDQAKSKQQQGQATGRC
jgi:hypothetical protein